MVLAPQVFPVLEGFTDLHQSVAFILGLNRSFQACHVGIERIDFISFRTELNTLNDSLPRMFKFRRFLLNLFPLIRQDIL